MAPPIQRKPLPKNDFAKHFSTLKTQTYTDPPTRGSSGTIHRTISWNHTGGLIATGATDRTVRIWNPERTNGRTQTELKGHMQEVTKVLFNPVKEFELASCSKDGSVRFWDTRSKSCVASLTVGGDLFSMAWSVDGSAMVVGNKVGKIWGVLCWPNTNNLDRLKSLRQSRRSSSLYQLSSRNTDRNSKPTTLRFPTHTLHRTSSLRTVMVL